MKNKLLCICSRSRCAAWKYN